MPTCVLVAMTGFRVREREMAALGMALPGLGDRGAAVGALPALGVLTLAGMCPDGWDASYIEAAAYSARLAHEIALDRPALVGISALSASILEAYRLADDLRSAGIRVVIGGLHATACPQEASLHADAVVVGDGEAVWPRVLSDAERGELQPVYRAAVSFDLSRAPLPRFDLLGDRERPRYTVQTQRGCPLACEFCGASRVLGPFREKPAVLVERELDAVTSLQRRAVVELADDNTFAGRRDPSELLGVLERSGVRYFTESDWRIGERPEVLDGLAASGCVQVLIGFESLARRHKGMGSKNAEPRRMMDAAQNIQRAGVAVIGCFVVGGDGETHDSMHELGEYLLESPLADVQLTLETPFPGTALRARLEREGRLLADRSWDACTLFDVAYRPDLMSADELQRAFYSLVRYVFAARPAARRAEIRRSVWGNRYGARV